MSIVMKMPILAIIINAKICSTLEYCKNLHEYLKASIQTQVNFKIWSGLPDHLICPTRLILVDTWKVKFTTTIKQLSQS
jgi:hypothetical protein